MVIPAATRTMLVRRTGETPSCRRRLLNRTPKMGVTKPKTLIRLAL